MYLQISPAACLQHWWAPPRRHLPDSDNQLLSSPAFPQDLYGNKYMCLPGIKCFWRQKWVLGTLQNTIISPWHFYTKHSVPLLAWHSFRLVKSRRTACFKQGPRSLSLPLPLCCSSFSFLFLSFSIRAMKYQINAYYPKLGRQRKRPKYLWFDALFVVLNR